MLLKRLLTILSIVLISIQCTYAHKPDTLSSSQFFFTQNKGQWNTNILFKSDIDGGSMYLEKNCITYNFVDNEKLREILGFKYLPVAEKRYFQEPDRELNCHAYKMFFVDCNKDFKYYGEGEFDAYKNFFIGNDKSKWASYVKSFSEVHYVELYDGIDFHLFEDFYSLKYEFDIAANADPYQIQLDYQGVEKISIKDGNLIIKTSVNKIIELKPIAYYADNHEHKIDIEYKLDGTTVSFIFPKSYDYSRGIIIDPTLIFASYTGSVADNWGYTATYDDEGFLYAGGTVFGIGYPVLTGSYQVVYGGGVSDIAISKFDTTGTFLIYSTYIGGIATEVPNSLIVNNSGELLILGITSSINFPTTISAFDRSFNGGSPYVLTSIITFNGSDMVISKLSNDGASMLSSTFLGGSGNDGLNVTAPLKHNYADDVRGEILIDDNDNVYVVSSTTSIDFPTSASAIQPTYGGGAQDGCISKFDANLSHLIWASYLGGNSSDACYSIVLDNNQDIYVSGGTASQNFRVTPNTIQQNYNGGGCDGYISHINKNGTRIFSSTYYGSTLYDQIYFVETDKYDNVYVLGQTSATGYYFIQNVQWFTPSGGQFISKLNSDLSTIKWSTAFGTGNGGPDISPTAFMVDLCNYIYLSAWGGTINAFGSTHGLPVTSGALQTTTDGSDYYFMVLKDDASALEYASFYGGSSGEHVDGGTSRFDRMGRIYQSVCAGCGGYDDFPTTQHAFSNDNGSSNCNLAVIKLDFNISVILADFPIPPVICLPDTSFFNNGSYVQTGHTYTSEWDFGDGSSSSLQNPYHIYPSMGLYDVRLIVTDSSSCNINDTIMQQVLVLSGGRDTLTDIHICNGDFTQIGLLPISDPSVSYTWDNNSTLSSDSISNPIANPSLTTIYQLLISNTNCTDTVLQKVIVTDLHADAGNDTTVCIGGFSLTAGPLDPGLQYFWSTNTNFTDTLNNINSPILSRINSTPSYYFLRVFDGACESFDSVYVDVSVISYSKDTNRQICLGDSVLISVNNNNMNRLTYNWTPTNNIISLPTNRIIQVKPDSNTMYYIEITDSLGCSITDSIYIGVTEIKPRVSFSDIDCFGSCDGLISCNPRGGNFPYTYMWSNGNNTSQSNTLCAGIYTISITDVNMCKTVVNQQINQQDSLYIILTDTTNVNCDGICDGSASVQAIGGTPPYQYQWINGQTGSTAINLCAGLYYVDVYDSLLCSARLEVVIRDTSDFVANVNYSIPLCYDSCNASADVIANLGQPPYTYLWNTTANTANIANLCSDIYNVSVTDANNCIRNIYIQIPQPQRIEFNLLDSIVPSCFGFSDGSLEVDIFGGTSPIQQTWNTGSTNRRLDNISSGTYSIVAIDSNQCIVDTSFYLDQPPPLQLITNHSTTPCVEVCLAWGSVFAYGGSPNYNFLWSDGQTNDTAYNLCAGQHIVTITDSKLCVYADTMYIDVVNNFPNIFAWADQDTIFNGQSTVLHSTELQNYTYRWMPDDGVLNPTNFETEVIPTQSSMYVVEITDQYGCKKTDTVYILVLDVFCDEQNIFIPNAFTPNGDGINDILYVRSGVLERFSFRIYDRWGEKVFETYDINVGWDGTFRGEKCDPDVYDYYIDAYCINKQNNVIKGNITLIR